MGNRSEEDLLGSRDVPQEAYWGIHSLRAQENYQISGRTINEVPELIRAFAQVKKAAAPAIPVPPPACSACRGPRREKIGRAHV